MDRIKRGYLNGDFEYFHLRDQKSMEFEFHYHDFNKIIVFISGDVTYLIEGKTYKLKPWDILFVSSHDVHMPVIKSDQPYERIVIWINSQFLEMHNNADSNLLTCFDLSTRHKLNLLRANPESLNGIRNVLSQLEHSIQVKDFGSQILKNSLFIQLMVYLNRIFIGIDTTKVLQDVEYDERIEAILDYINENLNEELSVDFLSQKFFTSKYYLMHKFKEQTGFTIHSYIQQKRLIYANSLIRDGAAITDACTKCGFGDYSSFVRAFRKLFGLSPRDYHKALNDMEDAYKKSKHIPQDKS